MPYFETPGPIIDIHLPARKDFIQPDMTHQDPSLQNWGRADLAIALHERGANPIFSRGPKAYDMESMLVTVLRPSFNFNGMSTIVEPDIIAFESIGSIRNVTKAIGYGLPELNQPNVRLLARDKLAANELLAQAGIGKEYMVLDESVGIDEALDGMKADQVVVKPRKGSKSKNLHLGSKSEIRRKYTEGEIAKTEQWIIEERLDFTPPLAVRGENEQQQARINAANQAGDPKELRTYVFGRDEQGRPITSYVMRAALPGDQTVGRNDWIYIDPESIPSEIISHADTVLNAMERATGVPEIHIAVDSVVAYSRSQKSIITVPMEINASEPQLVYRNEHPGLAKLQTGLLVEQLMRVAARSGNV